jgi:hypothetical protein
MTSVYHFGVYSLIIFDAVRIVGDIQSSVATQGTEAPLFIRTE